MAQGRNRSIVVVVGAYPPPVHGASTVTQRAGDAFRKVTSVTVVDTAVRNGKSAYHLRRTVRHAFAAAALVRYAPRTTRFAYLACPGGAAIWYNVALVLVARLLRYNILVHHHSFAYLVRAHLSMRVLTALGGRTAVHLCLCPRMAHQLRSRYHHVTEVLVCSNAAFVGAGEGRPSDRMPQAGPVAVVLGHLGNLSVEKGLSEVFDVVHAAARDGLRPTLRLAGPCATEKARQLIKDAKAHLGDTFQWIGPVDDHQRSEFLRGIDVLLFPSRYVHEAQPLVILEALAEGVPVVAFRRGCIEEEVGTAGVLVREDEDFAFCALQYLRRLAEEPGFRQSQREQALYVAKEARLSACRRLDEILQTLQAVAERNDAPEKRTAQ